MSLINEALKKVQNQQGETGPTKPPGPPVTPHVPHSTHPDKTRHRSFVWGFVVAVLVIGLVTTLLATFFVWQILGPEKPAEKSSPPVVQSEVATPEPVKPEVPAEVEAPPEIAQNTPANTEAAIQTNVKTRPAAPKQPLPERAPVAVNSTPEPIAVPPTEITTSTQPPAPTLAAQPQQPAPPNPDVITRLQELEIRGIMSGGIKVLIQDKATGRTRAYRVDEALEGPMGLVVVGITPSTIQFKDYAGSIHTKSF